MKSPNALVPLFINTTTFVASIFGSGEAQRGSIPRSGAVTEKQRSQNRKATQPSGRRFFLAQTSLLAPYRPLKGMRVARASSGPKIPRRKRGRIYEMEYLVAASAGFLVLSDAENWAAPFGMSDTNFVRPRFTATVHPGYVRAD